MTKRNVLLFSFPLLLALTFVVAWWIWHQQGEHFEATYLAELHRETENRLDQTILFFQPLLENNDLETLDRYCGTLGGRRESVALFDRRGVAIVASDDAELRGILDAPDIVEAIRHGRHVSVRRDPQTGVWTAYATAQIQVRSKSLLIRFVLPDPNVGVVLRRLESSFVVFLFAPFALVYLIWYLVRRVANPLDRLQASAERIAAGDLSVAVAVPQKGAIRELALSMSTMTERLKKEVEKVRRQEKFRSDFIANVSHEIKTPLTGILSAIQLLDDGGWNNPVYLSKCRDVLTRQTQTLQALVRDVLLLAEIERMEELDTEFSPVPFDEIVRIQIRLCMETFKIAESKLCLSRCDIAVVTGNERLLGQAVFNLLSNAVKYGGESSVEVSLFVRNDEVRLTIRDHGPGIPEELSERVFERFYRIPREYGRRPEGTGLGLAMVRQIAALHHGSVRLEQVDPPGVCFLLTLPKDEKSR